MNRKQAPHRDLRLRTMRDIGDEVDRLSSAAERRQTAEWTPAQNVDHVATFIGFSLEGFPFTVPLPMRLMGKLIKNKFINNPFKAGFNAPAFLRRYDPPADISWDDAVAHITGLLTRIDSGEQMTHKSPFLGEMSHEDWVKLHTRHAELHLGFIQPVDS